MSMNIEEKGRKLHKSLRKLIKDFFEDKEEILPYKKEYFPSELQHLSSIYEEMLNNEQQKMRSSFYTPENIIKLMVETTLGELVNQRIQQTRSHKKKLSSAILSIKVLDNAMGTGRFLLEALEFLAGQLLDAVDRDIHTRRVEKDERYTLELAKQEVLKHCMYGVDLDNRAVEIAKMALWIATEPQVNLLSVLDPQLKQGNSLFGASIKELSHKIDFTQKPDPKKIELLKTILDVKLSMSFGNPIAPKTYENFCSQALNGSEEKWAQLQQLPFVERAKEIAAERHFFHWELEFPEIFFGQDIFGNPRSGFDVIIGNPPWASVRGKHAAQSFDDLEIAYLEQKFPENTYMPNAYEYFISQSLRLLADNGYHSYIVPDRLGFNKSLKYLRKTFLEDYKMKSLIYKVPFPEVVVDTLIYHLQNAKPKENHKIEVTEYNKTPLHISSQFYKKAGDNAFLFFSDANTLEALEQIEAADTIELGKIADTTSGLGGRSSEITETRINNHQIKTIKGVNVEPYKINGHLYFEFKKENITGRTTDPTKLGAIPKVLLRKTGSVLYAAYEDTGIFPEQSLYFLYNVKQPYSPHYILTLLNSSLFKFYYLEKMVTNRDTTPQLKKLHLDRFPIRTIYFTTDPLVKRKYLTNFKNSYKKFLMDGNITNFRALMNKCLTKVEHNQKTDYNEKYDILHDFLSYLAEKMCIFKRNTPESSTNKKEFDRTEALIDLILHRLYNLTPKNIQTIKDSLHSHKIEIKTC